MCIVHTPYERISRIEFLPAAGKQAVIAFLRVSWQVFVVQSLDYNAPCFALSAPTRNTPAQTLLSEKLPGAFVCVPCFLRLRVLRNRPCTNFKIKPSALLQDKSSPH